MSGKNLRIHITNGQLRTVLHTRKLYGNKNKIKDKFSGRLTRVNRIAGEILINLSSL